MSNFDAKFYSVVLGTALAAVISTSVCAGPSAKFAATWTDWPALASVAVITDATVDTVVVDSKMGYTLARIKVPQDKELLVGVSAEIGLFTKTSVKGKKGGSATALADAASCYSELHRKARSLQPASPTSRKYLAPPRS